MAIATERKSTLAVKLELDALTGTAESSGTAVTGSGAAFDTELSVGDVIGTDTGGYRTITSITDADNLVVDSAYDVDIAAGTTFYKQAYGEDPTIAAADVIEFVPPFTFEPDRAEIARNVVNRSFDEIEPIMGQESVAGDIQIELHGSGTAGVAPESDPLWVCAIGEKSASAASATVAGCTTSGIRITNNDASKFKVGQHIAVDVSADATPKIEAARITAIGAGDGTYDLLTVSPAFSLAPAAAKTIAAGIHYRPTLTELHSIWGQFWRGDITLEKYKGNKCSGITLDFQSSQTVNPKFSFKGKETAAPTSAAYGLGAASYDSGDVHVARLMIVKMGGTLYPVSNVSLQIANELFERQDVTKSGIHSLIRVKRTVTGSFSLLYENKDIEDAFRAGTTAELFIASSDGSSTLTVGNIFALSMPKIKYTKVPKNTESGLYKYDVSFKAVRTSGEDSFFASML